MGEQDAMAGMGKRDMVGEIDPGRLLRLWPEIDVYGRIGRLLAAERLAMGPATASRSHDPAA